LRNDREGKQPSGLRATPLEGGEEEEKAERSQNVRLEMVGRAQVGEPGFMPPGCST
jgi:hypothetical protein